MPTYDNPEESSRVFAIITEEDLFRLVIRGHALIEETLDTAISDAFAGGTPRELRRLPLRARLALARALELISPEVSTAIQALAQIRHKWAHSVDDRLTSDDAQALRHALQPFFGDGVDLGGYDDESTLRLAVAAIHSFTGDTVEHALEQRAEAQAALAAWRERHTLTLEQVAEALRTDSTLTTGIEEEIVERNDS